MKKLVMMLAAGLLLFVMGSSAAFAQAGSGSVSGKAVRWDGSPIAGATIRALDGQLETAKEVARTTTAADGSYALSVPAGQAYWIHIDTFGSWWGYSYQTPFTVRPGETVSQVFFALGPRDVKDIVLPSPVSNVAPATGTNSTASVPIVTAPPPAAPPAAPPVVAQQPVSNVKPEVGYNNVAKNVTKVVPPSRPIQQPVRQAAPAPRMLPPTGAPVNTGLLAALFAALTLAASGLALRRLHPFSR